MPSSFKHFGVVGAGAWGTALAIAVTRAGRQASLWAFEPDLADAMASKRENAAYLPGVKLPDGVKISKELDEMSACNAIILATPAQHVREICIKLAAHLKQPTPLIIAAKGVELTTHK